MFTLWAIGLVVARRWSEVRTVAEQAEELHRRREEETRQAVEAERARIARDLHDSVAHSLAMIAIQAGGAASVLERDPAARRAEPALDRDDRPDRPQRDAAPAAPRRGGRRAAARTTARPRPDHRAGHGRRGCRARRAADHDGRGDPVAPGVGLAAYRIVQEALTNAAKHTPEADHGLLRAGRDDQLTVEVVSRRCTHQRRTRSAARHRRHARAGPGGRRQSRDRSRPVRRVPRAGRSSHGGGRVSVRVLIVDDQELVRTGLEMMVDGGRRPRARRARRPTVEAPSRWRVSTGPTSS